MCFKKKITDNNMEIPPGQLFKSFFLIPVQIPYDSQIIMS